jgi:hypothetical protein
MHLGDAAEGGRNGDFADSTTPTEESAPFLVLVASQEGRGASWAAEIAAAGARAVLVTECSALARMLESRAVDAVVICGDDTGKCRDRVAAARRQICLAERTVPLIVWRADSNGPCGARSVVYQIGADSVLDAPSPVSDLLSCTFALRRLIRSVHAEA